MFIYPPFYFARVIEHPETRPSTKIELVAAGLVNLGRVWIVTVAGVELIRSSTVVSNNADCEACCGDCQGEGLKCYSQDRGEVGQEQGQCTREGTLIPQLITAHPEFASSTLDQQTLGLLSWCMLECDEFFEAIVCVCVCVYWQAFCILHAHSHLHFTWSFVDHACFGCGLTVC